MVAKDDRKRGRIGVQAYRAVKRVCQYISVHQLGKGRKLPTHQELAGILGFSNDTLMTAMRELTACGALERRTGVGTILADPAALPTLVWSVGVATIPSQAYGPGSVFADLAMRLQTEIARQHWRGIHYCHLPDPRLRSAYGDLASYGPLLQDFEDGLLDALIHFVPLVPSQRDRLTAAGTIVYHTPFDESAPCGLIVDEPAMAVQAAKLLVSRGCRSLAAISIGNQAAASPDRRFWPALQQAVAQLGLPAGSLGFHHVASMQNAARDSEPLARRLLALPEGKRPEGLIILDDYIAFGLTEHLAQHSEYRPHITIVTHMQRPLAYHLPVVRFQVDLHEMTRRIIQDIGRRLANPSLPPELQLITPVVQTQRAQRIPFLLPEFQK